MNSSRLFPCLNESTQPRLHGLAERVLCFERRACLHRACAGNDASLRVRDLEQRFGRIEVAADPAMRGVVDHRISTDMQQIAGDEHIRFGQERVQIAIRVCLGQMHRNGCAPDRT